MGVVAAAFAYPVHHALVIDRRCCFPLSLVCRLPRLLQDPFANYVIQSVLAVVKRVRVVCL